jgi:hypothetical protein
MLQPQELVMGKPQKKYDPKNNQDQDQDQKQDQAQAQANLQAQLQGQGQGQAQGQGQLQFAVQSLDSKSENDNDNKNDNKNSNENENKLDNRVDNDVDNKVDNDIDNKIENTVDNKVNVDVNVDLDLDLKADGLSSPVIDLNHFTTTDSIVMPDVVNQTLNGGGNQFNIDQVNNLADQDVNTSTTTYSGGGSYPGSGFDMDAKIEGGESKIDGAHMGDAIGAGAGIASHADAVLNQSAFDQNITQGANIQFNSITMEVAGHDLTDSHDTL